MKLLVGLGNPGSKHARQRHNIGFMAVDAIHGAEGFAPWRQKFQAEIAEGRVGSERVMLVKPQTYMNLSGQAVGEAMRYLKVTPDDVTVFHDELDLAPGKVRLKTGGGHAGHNGLRSIHGHIGESYHRVRLGIGHPGRKELVSGYVLHDFSSAEHEWLDPLIEAIGKAAALLVKGDGPGFLNRLALERPPKPAPPPKEAPKIQKPEPGQGGEEAGSLLERLARHFSGR